MQTQLTSLGCQINRVQALNSVAAPATSSSSSEDLISITSKFDMSDSGAKKGVGEKQPTLRLAHAIVYCYATLPCQRVVLLRTCVRVLVLVPAKPRPRCLMRVLEPSTRFSTYLCTRCPSCHRGHPCNTLVLHLVAVQSLSSVLVVIDLLPRRCCRSPKLRRSTQSFTASYRELGRAHLHKYNTIPWIPP